MDIIIPNFGIRKLIANLTSTDTTIPLDANDLQFIVDSLAPSNSTIILVTGGIYAERIRLTESSGMLIVERSVEGTEARSFLEGDCVTASDGDQDTIPDAVVSTCRIGSGTPDSISITGDCESGINIGLRDGFPDDRICDTVTQLSVIPMSTRVLVDGCAYITISQLCSELSGCQIGSGDQGPAGQDGQDGVNGVDGINGLNGADGSDGQDGVDGVNGLNGTNGTNGLDGQDGVSAQSGPFITVDALGTVIHNLPNPNQAPTETYCGVQFDAAGHAIGADPACNEARWSGDLGGATNFASNATASVDATNNKLCFVFASPMPNSFYYISIVDNNGAPVVTSITDKTTLGFCVTLSSGQANIYVHA